MNKETLDKLIEYGDRKDFSDMTWEEIKDSLNNEFGLERSESYYRKKYHELVKSLRDVDEVSEDDTSPVSSSFKVRDELNQANALFRRLSREETIKEIAHDFALVMNKEKMLPHHTYSGENKSDYSGILMLSDWHYGVEFETYGNVYNTRICKARVHELGCKVLEYIKRYNLSELTVINLADMIAGRIHLQLRLNSRIDVVTQIMEVSEIIAEFIEDLSRHVKINYYEVLDNHSRLEPNKKEAMNLESLARITSWYLKERLEQYSNVNISTDTRSFVDFKVRGFNIMAVHGDKDKPSTVASDLSRYTDKHIDIVCTAHRHHFSCEEDNKTIVVCNGTLMGTDEYAEDLRLSSTPSQNLIIVSDENPTEAIHRIILK